MGWKRDVKLNTEDLENLRLGLDEAMVHIEEIWSETRDRRLLRCLKLLEGVAGYARELVRRNHPQARMWEEDIKTPDNG